MIFDDLRYDILIYHATYFFDHAFGFEFWCFKTSSRCCLQEVLPRLATTTRRCPASICVWEKLLPCAVFPRKLEHTWTIWISAIFWAADSVQFCVVLPIRLIVVTDSMSFGLRLAARQGDCGFPRMQSLHWGIHIDLAPPGTARVSQAVVDSRLVVHGGHDGNKWVADMHILDTRQTRHRNCIRPLKHSKTSKGNWSVRQSAG